MIYKEFNIDSKGVQALFATTRQIAEERVEVGNKVAPMFVVAWIKPGELEHHGTDILSDKFFGFPQNMVFEFFASAGTG